MIRNLILVSLSFSLFFTAYVWAQPDARSPESLTDIISSSGLDSIRPYLVSPKGKVVKVAGSSIYIANETGGIVRKGTRLEIVRDKEAIKHPLTGEILGVITETVGQVEIVSSDNNLFVTTLVGGGAKINVGDSIADDSSLAGGSAGKPSLAMAAFLSLETWDAISVSRTLNRKLAQWDTISLVPNSVTERFVYDRKITGKESLIGADIFESIGKILKADYLIVLDVKEQNGSILTDISLYRLNKDRAPLVSFSGITPDPETKYRAGVSKKRKVEPSVKNNDVGAPKIIARPSKQPSTILANKAPTNQPTNVMADVNSRARKLGRFKERITAVHVVDLDRDGVEEIIVGFDKKIVSYKLDKDGLKKVWEKQLGPRDQVLGISAGDFNGNGEVEIYVNNAVSSSVRSLILEQSGSSYRVIADRLNMLFFTGEDGKLYGQSQKNDYSLENRLVKITWNGEQLDNKPFLTFPKNSRLTGFGIKDIDGDGVTDVAAYTGNYSLVYYLSSQGNWEQATGSFGGSNVKIKLYEEHETDIFQEFLGPVLFEPVSNGGYNIIATRNKGSVSFVSDPSFKKARIVWLEYDGVRFVEKSETPLVNGAITSMALLRKEGSNALLVARNYPSFFSNGASELILLYRSSN